MNRKIFFTRSFRITVASLAVTLLSQGRLLAQVPTPATSGVAAQASRALASEEIVQGVHVDILEIGRAHV